MAPRADYECRKCRTTYEDLPVDSRRCPICGWRRGFRRLFNGVQVSTKGHKIAQVLDPMMDSTINTHTAQQREVREARGRLAEARDEALHRTSGPERQAIAETVPIGATRWASGQAAASAFAAVPAEARFDSRHYIYPHIKRTVVPRPVNG